MKMKEVKKVKRLFVTEEALEKVWDNKKDERWNNC